MKTYEQLRPEEQEDAYQDRLRAALGAIALGILTFEGPINDQIATALEGDGNVSMEQYATLLMADLYIKDVVEALALAEAQVAFYLEPGDNVVEGIAQ